MAWVTEAYRAIWRSQRHVGRRRPMTVVEVRRGNYRHDYNAWPGRRVNANIPGESSTHPWWPIFTETTPWIEIPNVAHVEISKDYDQRGTVVATINVDNVAYVEQTGPLGHVFHLIRRGWMSPLRGFKPPTRADDGLEENEWRGVLSEQANIRIWQGFGDPERVDGEIPDDGGSNGAWVFNGFVDKVTPDSSPPSIEVVSRAGKQLTDERIYGYNKSVQLQDPVTFIDRSEADKIEPVGSMPKSSSDYSADFGAANVLTAGTDTEWRSSGRPGAAYTEWVSVHVPDGRYEDFDLHCPAGLEVFVGVYARDHKNGSPSQMDDRNVPDGAFVDGHMGVVPGDTNGGWLYVHHIAATDGDRSVHSLGHVFELGDNSVIRLGFRSLEPFPAPHDTEFGARVFEFRPRRRRLSAEARDGKWIAVNDISDMVRVALRWAGFSEWEVENTGTRLPGKQIFHRSNFLIDIIELATKNTGFVFFMADPDTGESFGIPTFRRGAYVSRDVPIVAELRDTDFLTEFTPVLDEEPRAYIIRVRGKEASKKKGGRTLDGDPVRRLYASYRPPWTRDDLMAGIVKHVTYQNPALRTVEGCKMACYLIALEEALAASKAQGEIPANVNIELDDQVGVRDTGSGVNMRWYIASVRSTWEGGENATHKMSLGGALIDSEYVTGVLADIEADATGDAPSGAGEIGDYPRKPLATGIREPRIR